MMSLYVMLIFLLSCYFTGVILIFIDLYEEYDKPINDKKILESLKVNINLGVKSKLEFDNNTIIIIGNMPKIKKLGYWMYFISYDIEGIGIIPIWYKSHKIINKIYKEEHKKNIEAKKIRKEKQININLGI